MGRGIAQSDGEKGVWPGPNPATWREGVMAWPQSGHMGEGDMARHAGLRILAAVTGGNINCHCFLTAEVPDPWESYGPYAKALWAAFDLQAGG